MKEFEDDNFIVAQMVKFLFDRVENIMGKGENRGYLHFLLQVPLRFSKVSFPGV